MKNQNYCPIQKKCSYLRLLNFSRITRLPEIPPCPEKDKKKVVEALDSLLDSFNLSLRPVLPLIYHNACQAGLLDLLHPKAQKLLKENTLLLVGVEMLNRQWLKNILNAFKKEKITVILLKGAAFSGSLYPSDTPRIGVDLDLLVKEDDFGSACSLLSNTMHPVLLSSERVATYDMLFERVFVPRKRGGPTIEIHRGLTNPSIFNINENSLWEASRKHPAYDSELVHILSPEDTLLHLAVHAFRDLDFCTHNILDAHEVWCQWKPDPEKLVDRAMEWGARKVLYYLLVNCKAIMETPVPDTLLDNLKPACCVSGINKNILQSSAMQNSVHTSLRYRLIQLTSQMTFPDHIIRGLKFQLVYMRTRVKDWILARRNRKRSSR